MNYNPNRKIITPKGSRYPGSGREKGKPNPVSVEARILVSELVTNPIYQRRLRKDFELRRVHPTIESMVWAYFLGRPRQDVVIDATVNVNARLEEERRVFASLDLPDLERLAAESQELLDRAKVLAASRAAPGLSPPQNETEGRKGPDFLMNHAGSDNDRSVNYSEKEDTDDGTPTSSDT